MSFINVAGTTTEQTTDQSTAGLLKGSTSVARFNNKFILTGAPKASRLVAVWDGPGSASLYPYLAYFAKGNNPVKLPGWSIGALLVQDPANNASTVKGALAVKQSQNLVVPATDNPTVPNGSKSISGITRYTFGVKDTSPSNACVGWGTYVSDFKRLFSGKATLTGSGVLTQVVN